jgi:CHAT domain-containing protein
MRKTTDRICRIIGKGHRISSVGWGRVDRNCLWVLNISANPPLQNLCQRDRLSIDRVSTINYQLPTMDENRAQAYLQLINALLTCPNGEENQILNANLELVDVDLVQVMVAVAAQFSEKDRENEATFLLQTATQIAKFLGMNARGNSDRSASENPQEYENFILELLQAEQDSNRDTKIIYPMLTDRQHLLNRRFAEILPQVAQNLIAEYPDAIEFIVAMIGNLSFHISDFPRGNRANNIEIAIYQAALTVYTFEDFPENWAMTQNNLANAYSNRINGSRADNLERAIEFYQAALTVYTFEDFPEDWAMTQNNLGEAYRNRINGSRAENLERAIEFYQAALTVYTFEDFPEDWAGTQNNLANAYSDKINGSRADNLERAIEFYQAALTIRTREAFPQNHVETLSNLGELYRSNQQWQLAYDTYAPAIEIVEILRGEESGDENKQKLAEAWNKLYLGMVEVCIALQRYTEAVEYADRSKAQNLIELLSIKDLYPQGEIPPEVRRELQQLKSRIADENQRLKQAEEKNYDTINQLRQDLAEKYPYTPLKFGEIKQSIDEKTAIVEWYILNNSFCAFTITKNNSQPQFLSFNESDLNKLIDWGNEYLEDYYRNREQWQNSLGTKLANLAQILHIDEILAAIPETCDKLILIPHRYLHLFPIHALPASREIWQHFHRDNENCPLNPCLVDCFDNGVSYAPSCQILHQVQKYKRGKFDKFFAIQNPTDDLMAADMEVETIKNIFPIPEILAKQNAKKGEQLEDKLEIAEKVADSHHLFFSCHGSFNPNDPLQSGLELADETLTLEEIIRYFNLSECSLVTLSACETGQVQLDNTDEYISLTSGFLLAGSPSLYVTLWSVNAFSTAILLIKTYENLYHQPGKLALALNQAQIWVRDTDIQGFLDWTNQCHLLDKKWRETLQRNLNRQSRTQGAHAKIYQNPYYWAGFCAAGKGEQTMANSISKLEIFQQLIRESELFVNLRDALIYLKEQLTDNDEANVKIIETWMEKLPEADKNNILEEYEDRQLNTEKLGNRAKSPTKPGQESQILKEIIENLTVAPEKPPEPNQDTPPSV